MTNEDKKGSMDKKEDTKDKKGADDKDEKKVGDALSD